DQSLLEFYKELATVRVENRAAFAADCTIAEQDGLLILERGNTIRMAMNFSDRPQKVQGEFLFGEGFAEGILQPDGFAIIRI
ncbi:MAG: hypothetical protein IKK30_03270, partial [Clostridia bacterium]|nr:hypothetical protein [Clostridia bacterium]